MYSFYYEIRVLRAHDGAEPPESGLSQPASSSPGTFHPRQPSARARTLYVLERSPVLELNLGCWLIPLFWGLAGLRDRGTGTKGGPILLRGLVRSHKSIAIYRPMTRRRPIALIKQCSFSSCDL